MSPVVSEIPGPGGLENHHNKGFFIQGWLKTGLVVGFGLYSTIWLFNSSPWKIPSKWRFLAGKIIYFYGPSIPWQTVSHNQRVFDFGAFSAASFCGFENPRIPLRAPTSAVGWKKP